MDQQTIQLLTATAGLLATLGGVAVTQVFNRRGENVRRKYEARSRSHADNYRVSAAIVTKAVAIERTLHSAASFLDDDERDPRIPGSKSILFAPEEGVDGLFDSVAREILVEAIEDGFKVIDEMDDLRGELAILGSPEQTEAADELGDRILEAIGSLEMFAKYSVAWEEIHAIRHGRDSFAEAARTSLLATENS
jgi:hypothetical protein